jgi:hypothetical protein
MIYTILAFFLGAALGIAVMALLLMTSTRQPINEHKDDQQ